MGTTSAHAREDSVKIVESSRTDGRLNKEKEVDWAMEQFQKKIVHTNLFINLNLFTPRCQHILVDSTAVSTFLDVMVELTNCQMLYLLIQ